MVGVELGGPPGQVRRLDLSIAANGVVGNVGDFGAPVVSLVGPGPAYVVSW
jgi:hypothetical protein